MFKEVSDRPEDLELKKENDFLHLRLQQMNREVDKLSKFKDAESRLRDKVDYYEQIIEEMTNTNTELTLSLFKTKQITEEKQAIEKQTDGLILEARQLRVSNADLTHKLQTQKMLFEQYKDFVRTNIDVFDFEKYNVKAMTYETIFEQLPDQSTVSQKSLTEKKSQRSQKKATPSEALEALDVISDIKPN